MSKTTTQELCAYCGKPAQGNFSIHRDFIDKGPQVPLCDACGGANGPSCNEIWSRISQTPSDRDYVRSCIIRNAAEESIALCQNCGNPKRIGEPCKVCGVGYNSTFQPQEPRIASPSPVTDHEERQAWDRYFSHLRLTLTTVASAADEADKMLSERRQRFPIK